MSPRVGLPTPAQVRRLQDAATMLGDGRAVDALPAARALASELPELGKVQHLLALCLKASGELNLAKRTFEAAERLEPRDSQLLANHANLLWTLGETQAALEKYRAAVGMDANNAEAWVNYSVILLRQGAAREACEAASRATQLSAHRPAAWHALGAAQRALGDLDSAGVSLRMAVDLEPKNPSLRLALGVIERLQGRADAALDHYRVAGELGMQGAEWLDARASALLDIGEPKAAIEVARTLCERYPHYVAGQLMLAEILWEHGESTDDAIEHLERITAARTDDPALRHGATELLLAARRPQAALAQLRWLREYNDQPELAALEAEAHWQAGDPVRALEALADAPEAWRKNLPWRRTQVRVLLAARRPELAAKAATDTLAWAGYDQQLLALLSTAWRMSTDSREYWLCDYEGLVRIVDIDVAPFIEELRALLQRLHRARAAPLRQSLRQGSQTAGNLLGRGEPVIIELRRALQHAVSSVLEQLPPDNAHPFLVRNTRRTRFVGSWSAQLQSGGRHVNHFHQEGWLSSAFYVLLPPSMESSSSSAGCLQFGQPDEELRLGSLPPRHMLRPKVGRLALFPSYLWHGTVPFTDAQPRLTIAFDAQPA